MAQKTAFSAVVIVPPDEVWSPIQIIRRKHDRQIGRSMPHIKLLHPFQPGCDLATATSKLRRVCAEFAPFPLRLRCFRSLDIVGGGGELCLEAETRDRLLRLQTALVAAFPNCVHQADFEPHLSVGEFDTRAACDQMGAELQVGWRPITFLLQGIALIAQEENNPYTIVEHFRLGPDPNSA